MHTEASPNWGGQEMRILEQVRWLNGHGHTAWIAARPDSEILKHARMEGLRCFDVSFRGNGNPLAIAKLAWLVRKHHVDLIDCHSARDAIHCGALGLLGIPIVRSLHVEIIKNTRLHRFFWRHGNRRIVVVSEVLKRRLSKLGYPSAKIDVINEGIDLEEFNCRRAGDKIRTEFAVPRNCKIVTNIAMLRPDKGQKHFVAAAGAIAAAIPDVYFMIVGSATRPGFESELRAQIDVSTQRDRFILTGYRADVADLITASDCVVVSSLQEAHSRVVPQAFAMKRPVVATDVGGLPDLVIPGITGTLVPPADSGALAAAVVDVLTKENSQELEHAHSLALQNCDFETTMERTLASYRLAMTKESADRPGRLASSTRLPETQPSARTPSISTQIVGMHPIPILMYHNIGKPPDGVTLRKLYVREGALTRQMALLRLMGYRGVSMREAMPFLRGELKGRVVAITFDDGYVDTLELALPILKLYGHTATCYVVSRRIGRHNLWDADSIGAVKPLMNKIQIRQWHAAGMEVGAHSQTHPQLPRCSDAELFKEVGQCKVDLEGLIQDPVTQFCYPYGAFDKRIEEAVVRAGYEAATTTRRGRAAVGMSLFSLPRVLVAGHHLLSVLAWQVMTSYEDKRAIQA